MPTIPDRGWMAGVIDTRGKIKRIDNPMRKTMQLVLMVQSQQLAVVERLAKLTGTKPRYADAKTISVADRRGCLKHCPEPHIHVEPYVPATGIWAITGAGAAVVLHGLLPYLATEKGMATFVEEAVAGLPTDGRGRHAVDQAVERLRKLGWKVPEALQPETTKAMVERLVKVVDSERKASPAKPARSGRTLVKARP